MNQMVGSCESSSKGTAPRRPILSLRVPTEALLVRQGRDRQWGGRARAGRTCKAVCDVHLIFRPRAQQHAHHALFSVSGYAIVVVHDAEQHQRMYADLLERRHLSALGTEGLLLH